MQRFGPGADLEAPGTVINAELLTRILCQVATESEPASFGDVSVTLAQFTEDVSFADVRFNGSAAFDGAQFVGEAGFQGAQFSGKVSFFQAQFSADTRFSGAQFSGPVTFGGAQFSGDAWFEGAQFARRVPLPELSELIRSDGAKPVKPVEFDGAQFSGEVSFLQAQFSADTGFSGAQFSEPVEFGGAQFSGDAEFDRAQFSAGAEFNVAQFSRSAGFEGARFVGPAEFYRARFSGLTTFGGAQFGGPAWFEDALFSWGAEFRGAQFSADARFNGAQFSLPAWFDGARFSANAGFNGAKFNAEASFVDVRFEKVTSLGPLAAANLMLQRAVFGRPVRLDISAVFVTCADATWEAGVTMRLRYAKVDLGRATFSVPSLVSGVDQPFVLPPDAVPDHLDERPAPRFLGEDEVLSRVKEERGESDDSWMPVLLSLRGADASNLSVTDVDLSECRFVGATLLDQLRLEGRCLSDHPPKGLRLGWAWPPVWRWSRRQSLTEERLWRATRPKYSGWSKTRSGETAEVRPERLAALYRQLRKAQEDVKNEPGAADFYYGEMEMRRHAGTTPVAERAIIWLYWLISGYGLRALRSLAALVILGVIITTGLTGWGLVAADLVTAPPQQLAGTITTAPHQRLQIKATLSGISPQLPPASQRWTIERTGTALEVTLESFAFRSTDQPLTTAGAWITTAGRILGPVLLALTLLAVRNRVKR